ncbi:hypothetical protein COLO4_36887 [Corchorus olitorius]|uniref:Uncharacterized protein n=1 Tax=Corchorus olitorius TaxID=93759 RepID=A0A1R3G4G7_9ROSI|nr:hypothetical protein COLO4_36887 [Corchorus olitorius]
MAESRYSFKPHRSEIVLEKYSLFLVQCYREASKAK